MKVGDLVKLSAYGKKRKRAEWISPDDVGLIIKCIEFTSPHYPTEYEVRWVKSLYNPRRWAHNRINIRADLKYVKLKTIKGEK